MFGRKLRKKQVAGTTVTWVEKGRDDLNQVYPGLYVMDAIQLSSIIPSGYKVKNMSHDNFTGWGRLVVEITPEPEDKEQREFEEKNFNQVASTGISGRISDLKRQDEHGRVECKRCGVVYKPRNALTNPVVSWNIGGHDEPLLKADEALLVGRVSPQGYCPRCEEHLSGVREYLLECLKKKPVIT